MLDERTSVLLKILNEKCSSGSYKIITSDELILKFPTRYGADKDLIWQMVIHLSQNGFISVKYDRDGEFCLALTPKGRVYSETDLKQTNDDKKPSKTDLLPYFYNFLSIFAAIVLGFLTLKIFNLVC